MTTKRREYTREFKLEAISLIRSFISHLCGDEVYPVFNGGRLCFLSHLCGEEGWAGVWVFSTAFLSHLCGEEDA